jgi:hypothetical protein
MLWLGLGFLSLYVGYLMCSRHCTVQCLVCHNRCFELFSSPRPARLSLKCSFLLPPATPRALSVSGSPAPPSMSSPVPVLVGSPRWRRSVPAPRSAWLVACFSATGLCPCVDRPLTSDWMPACAWLYVQMQRRSNWALFVAYMEKHESRVYGRLGLIEPCVGCPDNQSCT